MYPQLADTLVHAGDISNTPFLHVAIEEMAKKWKNVIFVVGNHDHWHATKDTATEKFMELRDRFPNVHWLNNSSVVIDGQRFIGGTQWFPISETAKSLMHEFKDFSLIPWLRDFVNHEHTMTKNFLASEVKTEDIVVTHHLPSYQLVTKQWQGDPFNVFFAADMETIWMKNKPKMWLFGHTHDSIDKTLEGVRFVCNPLGTLYMINPEFNDRLVLDSNPTTESENEL